MKEKKASDDLIVCVSQWHQCFIRNDVSMLATEKAIAMNSFVYPRKVISVTNLY
ncbi:hypothetical protein EC50959_2779 [Escherichia coli 5.0959]|nr:hypothetical protein EC50959_2779 [Escherichia coli 5.0959]